MRGLVRTLAKPLLESRNDEERPAGPDRNHSDVGRPSRLLAALAGVKVGDQGGHIPCPLPDHTERLASCMVYPDPGQGWWCYGCQRGGTVYDSSH